MKFLSRSASGTRTVAWGRKISANGRAHLEHNPLLTPLQRSALSSELPTIEARIEALASANDSYRKFLETRFVQISAMQRVANYCVDVAFEEGRGLLIGKRREVENHQPGLISRFLGGNPLSRVLRAGHVRTVALARAAAHTVSLLPEAQFPFVHGIEHSLRSAADQLDGFNTERAYLNNIERPPLRLAVERASADLREELIKMNARLRQHFSDLFIDSLYPELDKRSTRVIDEADDEFEEELLTESDLTVSD